MVLDRPFRSAVCPDPDLGKQRGSRIHRTCCRRGTRRTDQRHHRRPQSVDRQGRQADLAEDLDLDRDARRRFPPLLFDRIYDRKRVDTIKFINRRRSAPYTG